MNSRKQRHINTKPNILIDNDILIFIVLIPTAEKLPDFLSMV